MEYKEVKTITKVGMVIEIKFKVNVNFFDEINSAF